MRELADFENTIDCRYCDRCVPLEPGSLLTGRRLHCAHVQFDGSVCDDGACNVTPASRDVLDALPHWTDALDLGPDEREREPVREHVRVPRNPKPDTFGDFLEAYDAYLDGRLDYEDLPQLRSGAV